MTDGLALLAYWSVRQKLNRVTSVQFSSVSLRRTLCAPEVRLIHQTSEFNISINFYARTLSHAVSERRQNIVF